MVRIGIASDLHAYVPGRENPAYKPHLAVSEGGEALGENPISALKDLIRRENITADMLLCPGDMGNQADPTAIAYAWRALHEVATCLGAEICAAASGNHDIDSRRAHHPYDPLDALKRLDPLYPVDNRAEVNRYWSEHFALIEHPDARVVILNSAAYHWIEAEWERGRVSPRTIQWIETELRGLPPRPINILLCHHHPHRHPELRVANSSFDVMVDGNHLTQSLGTGEFGQWLIVHGHKHHPYLTYAAGTSQSPVVFSAGSFSGPLFSELSTLARNQFYLIEIPVDQVRELGLVGRIRSWVWAFQRGWVAPEGESGGLPHTCAFGCRESPITLAGRIDRILGAARLLDWGAVVEQYPAVEFLLQADFRGLKSTLATRHRIEIQEQDGVPVEIGRRADV